MTTRSSTRLATRSAVGAFDISHMGRLRFFGPEAARFLDASVTRRVTDMRPGQIRYGLVCNDRGGILDDVLVYRLAVDEPVDDDTPMFQVVVNASNRAKIVESAPTWLRSPSRRSWSGSGRGSPITPPDSTTSRPPPP